ncbi:MAG TPA: hypothetical protein VKT72_13330 [Candidatus Baltobacteraceae bacterium]|nr:hypothetical protein [Candidatus Baltobacteraceae bacterium]
MMHTYAYSSTIQAAGAPMPYPGLSYAIPDDDECPTSSYQPHPGRSLT